MRASNLLKNISRMALVYMYQMLVLRAAWNVPTLTTGGVQQHRERQHRRERLVQVDDIERLVREKSLDAARDEWGERQARRRAVGRDR